MTEPDPTDGPLDPAREDAVRRLLAEARHDEPLPPEVAARLDELVGRLAEERSRESRVGSLDQQRDKRARRRGLLLVAAAAAVVAVAVGPRITGSSGDDSASTAADSAGSSSSSEERASSGGDTAKDSPFAAQQQPAPEPAAQPAPPVTLTSAGLGAEVRRLLLDAAPGPEAYDSSLTLLFDDCPLPPGISPAYLSPATYDGQAALLTATPQSSGEQTADVYLCGESKPVRTVTVQLPR